MTAKHTKYAGTPLAIIWSFCNRLECLRLDVYSRYLQPLVGMPSTMFPLLHSLDIRIPDSPTSRPALVGTVDAFQYAPCLKNLKLVAPRWSVADLFDSQFPWAQLTNLHMFFEDGIYHARSILSQCSQLESYSANFAPYSDNEQVAPPCVLPKLHTINFTGGGRVRLVSEFFRPFSFPQLRVLTIDSSVWSEDILPQLHERSGFELEQLHISSLRISGTQLSTFLSRIPRLKRLSIHRSDAGDDGLLFALLHSSLPHTAILPDLEHLVLETPGDLAGNVLADMLESRWWPDPGPAASAPLSSGSHLMQANVRCKNVADFPPAVKNRLDALVAAGVLEYGA
ncbi:hypothetical protein FB451DRAFT_1414755 [Mycena latifolia]|nr:hypothetical protein FB451DRAFT_1414755 [Mycena latifolia]